MLCFVNGVDSDLPFYLKKFKKKEIKEMIEEGKHVEDILKKAGYTSHSFTKDPAMWSYNNPKEQKAYLKNPYFLKNYLGYLRFYDFPKSQEKAKFQMQGEYATIIDAYYGMFFHAPEFLRKQLAKKWIKMLNPLIKKVSVSLPVSNINGTKVKFFELKITFDEKDKALISKSKVVQMGKDIIHLFNGGFKDTYGNYRKNSFYRYHPNVRVFFK
mgnify:CR=1 FL=1